MGDLNIHQAAARGFARGADEYEAVVDAERGVLLRCASRLGGEDFDALEVEEIHFDEQFPEDTFASREPLPWP